ncbi:unnamed protein product [Ixodes pacificus]
MIDESPQSRHLFVQFSSDTSETFFTHIHHTPNSCQFYSILTGAAARACINETSSSSQV